MLRVILHGYHFSITTLGKYQHTLRFKILGDTCKRFVSNILNRIGISQRVERGRKREAASQAGWGLA